MCDGEVSLSPLSTHSLISFSLFPFSTHSVILDDSLGCLTCRDWSRKGSPARIPPPIPFNPSIFFLFSGVKREGGRGASEFLLILRTRRTNYLRWVARIRIRSRPRRRRWCQLCWVAAQVGTTPDLRKGETHVKTYSRDRSHDCSSRCQKCELHFILASPVNEYVRIFKTILNLVRGKQFDILEIILGKVLAIVLIFDNTTDQRFIAEYIVEWHNWHKCSPVNLLISNDLYRV